MADDSTVDPTADLAQSLHKIVARAQGSPGVIHVPAGTYSITNAALLPSGTTVDFQGSEIRMAYAGVFLKTIANTENVTVKGKLKFVGNGSEFAGIAFNNTTGVTVDLEADVSGLGSLRPLIVFNGCRQVKAGGALASQDSCLVSAADSSQVEVSGARAGPYTKDPAGPIVRATSTGTRGPVSDIYFHDHEIDGGGVLGTSGLVVVSAKIGTPDITNVRIERCKVSNSRGPVDGVDSNRCTGVQISNIEASGLNVGVAVIASNAKVQSVRASRCRAQALAFGDPRWQTENISGIEGQDIEATDCGGSFGSAQGAGISILQAPGFTTSDVTLRNIRSTDSGARVQKFGLGIGKDVHRVRVIGSTLSGVQGPVANLAGASELTIE
jgi:hypothetical protein